MREKDVNYFENTFVNKVICQENSCIKRTFHFKVNFEHQSTTFQRKTRKIRNKNGTCSFMWPLSKMLPYRIDILPFFTVCKKAIRCNFGEKFSQERDGKKPYCIYPANDLKLQK